MFLPHATSFSEKILCSAVIPRLTVSSVEAQGNQFSFLHSSRGHLLRPAHHPCCGSSSSGEPGELCPCFDVLLHVPLL